MRNIPRNGIPFYIVIVAVLCLGLMQGFLILNQDYFSDIPEGHHDVPLLSMKFDNALEPNNKLEPEIKSKLSFPKSNEDYFRNTSIDIKKKVYMFHHTINAPDGSEGAVILDMLIGHAYAYHQGGIYGGSCGEGNDVGRVPENSLIRTIGLQDFLQFSCPRDLETTDRKKVLPKKNYVEDGTRIFTPEYVELLKSVIRYPKRPENPTKTNIIVVHMSRGKKFTPCRKKPHEGFDAYLPNKHYQLLINKYMKDGYENKVIIYSQSTSYEDFDEFREKGYELHIDEAITDVWKAVINSDVFIMSRSAFSFVPALVATDATKVVYTPFWHQHIRGWEIVRKDILSQSNDEFKRLKATCKK
eukprot:CAMPEP_0197194260 /NCGR_PEP_ID=MMETSP1423-20130617/28939_1 /TAXON_ID=476441 /ORGANISM="Pseudo-nitzschia heimii, Strain UNC1101" /LENGTH=356 /DNA_ID=CAMNT_0042647661 /DNA_START=99 /DNA_END=1169 /DNA_ORIENTATION=-